MIIHPFPNVARQRVLIGCELPSADPFFCFFTACLFAAPGEAKVVKYEDQKMAIYKNEKGEIFSVSAACTHIKCEVAWNPSEKSWDCPCHGSRFSYTGEMLTAPARKDLAAVEILSSIKH